MAKAAPKKPEVPAVDGEAPAPKKKGKLPLILALAALLAAGGAATWYFMFRDKGEHPVEQAKPQPPKPPVFVPLDAFTVNLAAEQSEQYLQVAATLRVLDQAAADAAKQYMPEIRHKMLMLLSSKRPSEIASARGQERLAEEMRQTANNVLLAAAGRTPKPVLLDVPKPQEAAATSEGPKAEDQLRPEEQPGNPQENAPAAAAPAAAPQRATELARAAADDPVQSVFFTSFIIQ